VAVSADSQRLCGDTELRRDSTDRLRSRAGFEGLAVIDHALGTVPQLWSELLGHTPTLPAETRNRTRALQYRSSALDRLHDRPTDRHVCKAGLAETSAWIQVASIYDKPAGHGLSHLFPVDRTELLPLSTNRQSVRAVDRVEILVHQHKPLLSWEDAPEILGCDGIVRTNSSARVKEISDEVQRRSVPDVVGLGLEGKTPHSYGLTLEIPEMLSELCTDTALLEAVHGVDRLEDLRLIAGLAGGPRQSGYILREARATITGTRVQELVPDPGIGADPDANLLDIGSSALSNVGHLVDEADLRRE